MKKKEFSEVFFNQFDQFAFSHRFKNLEIFILVNFVFYTNMLPVMFNAFETQSKL